MIYLDSAAVVKLVHAEAESQALQDWLDERAETAWTSSALVEIEASDSTIPGRGPPGHSPGHPVQPDLIRDLRQTTAGRRSRAADQLPGLTQCRHLLLPAQPVGSSSCRFHYLLL
jgi:hypothetical protein